MNTLVKTAMAALAAVASAGALSFDDTWDRQAVRAVAAEAMKDLRGANELRGKAITLLPVRGDKNGYAERVLLGSFVNSGLTMVVSNDDKNDERFRRILREIRWDKAQTRLGSIDPATVDELGRLKSTQVFIEAQIEMFKPAPGAQPGATAEVSLLAYAVGTKQYVWSASKIVTVEQPKEPPKPKAWSDVAEEASVPLRVKIDTSYAGDESQAVAERLDTFAHGTAARLGFIAGPKEDPDVVVKISVERNVFDKAGNYARHEGKAGFTALLVEGNGFKLLDDRTVDARGTRGLGAAEADRNLAEAFAEQFEPWFKRTLKADSKSFAAVKFKVRLAKPIDKTGDLAVVDKFTAAASALAGTRSFKLVSRTDGELEFRAVYETAKFPSGYLGAYFQASPELGALLDEAR